VGGAIGEFIITGASEDTPTVYCDFEEITLKRMVMVQESQSTKFTSVSDEIGLM
jgi:hypothetical protein